MEKQLIYFNENNFKSEVSALEQLLNMCTSVITKFNELNIGDFKPMEFSKLFFDTSEYLFEKTMEGRPLEVGGMKLNKRKMYDILDKPGFDSVLLAVSKINDLIEFRQRGIERKKKPQSYLSFLTFDNVNKLVIKKEVLENLKQGNCVYANNDTSQLAFKVAKEISEVLNKDNALRKLIHVYNPKQFGDFINKILEVEYETQICKIKLDGVKSYD